MKYTLLTTVSFLLSILFIGTSSQAFAQETAATASAETVTQTLKDRVQKVLQSDEGKVEGLTSTQRTTFGLVGNLQKVVGSTLQIATVTGPTRIVELDKAAVILRQGKPITNEEVELNSPVLATGVFDQDGTYHVLRLTALSDAYVPTKRVTILGTLQAITTKAMTVSVLAGADDSQLSLPITTRTTYYDLLDTKIDKRFVKVNAQIVAIMPDPLTATSSALRVYVTSPVSTVSAVPIQ